MSMDMWSTTRFQALARWLELQSSGLASLEMGPEADAAAGTLCLRIDHRRAARQGACVSGDGWLEALEQRAARLGYRHVQCICADPATDLILGLEGSGYRALPVSACVVADRQRSILTKDLDAAARLDRIMRRWRPDHWGTLLFLVVNGRVLLIHKKTGHGAGKINAPGGKLEADETPLAGAVREAREEVGIDVRNPWLVAKLKFADTAAPQWFGYVFLSHDYRGVQRASPEADPQWFPLHAIPYHRMWEDDHIWLPRVLAGATVEGDFLFENGRLSAHRLAE